MRGNHKIKKRLQVIYFLLFTLPGLSIIGNYANGNTSSGSQDLKAGTHISFAKLNTVTNAHHLPEKHLCIRFRCGIDERKYSLLHETPTLKSSNTFSQREKINSGQAKNAIALSLGHILYPGFLTSYSFRPPPIVC